MKSISTALVCVFVLLILPLGARAQDAAEKPIKVDRNHSTVGFSVPIAGGISKVTGKFTEFSLDIVWDDDDPSKSSVSVEIQTASVATGYDGRDGDVKGDNILDVETYPTITFVSNDIRQNGTEFVAVGNFTLHGVTREIYLPVKVVTIEDPNDPGVPFRAFQVSYQFDRSDYGINWKHSSIDFFFGFDIDIDITILER